MTFPKCTLAQTRLAIIDLSPDGRQPMRDNTRDIAITFNGEIYNYAALRSSLENAGHRFSSRSDTEVILKAYLEYGERCPEYLDGMFAFVIWDNERGQAFMARDRFGKKPLYYHLSDGVLTVASEIKAILASGVRAELDPVGIDAYLSLMYVPPWRTIYRGIKTLLPAHRASFVRGTFTATRYWELPRTPIDVSYADAKEETRRLLTEAVRKRMLASDVEIGAFLSGGIDSTLVTAYAQQFVTHPIKTFTLGYGAHIDELPYAAEAARVIGTEHHTTQADTNALHELETILGYLDEPHGDSSDFPQHLLSRFTAQHVKVAVCGDGGDELFLGYGWYWAQWNRPKLGRLRSWLMGATPYDEHLRSVTVFSPEERRTLWKDAAAVGSEPIDHLVTGLPVHGIEKMNRFDISTYLPGQLLVKADQMSMMHGLEVRSPLLDHHLAEFAVNLPVSQKMTHSTGKLILKDLLAEVMPRGFVDRKKQGFGAPVRAWLSDERGRSYVERHLLQEARIFAYLEPDAVRARIEHTYARRRPKAFYQLWVLLCLELWLRSHEHLL
jgi:asparagine synthase (glutamine-hydrolysing)